MMVLFFVDEGMRRAQVLLFDKKVVRSQAAL
jgi:hypothetical protein